MRCGRSERIKLNHHSYIIFDDKASCVQPHLLAPDLLWGPALFQVCTLIVRGLIISVVLLYMKCYRLSLVLVKDSSFYFSQIINYNLEILLCF